MKKKTNILKTLIVEDDPLSQKVTTELLSEHYHCKIDTAKTATDALDLINDKAFEWDKEGYDFILVDIYLPDINGDSLTEVIRKTETQTKTTPIIAISGKVSEKYRKTFQVVGMTDLLLKPISFEQLDSTLQKYLKDIDLYRK